MNTTRRPARTTEILPANWAPSFPASQPEPRRRYPRNTASLAVTTRLPVL